jgi:hypothetical protein
MNTKACYFCNSTLTDDNFYIYCRACKNKYDLAFVYTEYSVAYNNGDLKLYGSAIGIYINDIYYYVVLGFMNWRSQLCATANETEIYVKDKLKKYLVFS